MRLLLGFVLLISLVHAETGHDAWLRYQPQSAKLPSTVVKLGEEAELSSAAKEMSLALSGFHGKATGSGSVVLGTVAQVKQKFLLAVSYTVHLPGFDMQRKGIIWTLWRRHPLRPKQCAGSTNGTTWMARLSGDMVDVRFSSRTIM